VVTGKEAALRFKADLANGKPPAVPTGLAMADRIYGGFPTKMITILLGDASIGKSARALQACEALGFGANGRRALYITLEEPVEAMVSRRVFGQTGISYADFRAERLSPGQKAALDKAADDYIRILPLMTAPELFVKFAAVSGSGGQTW
jgi:replicative DNA helicase